MDAAKIFEGIARLIDLAQRGEINPWDVQVIEVIDRYLSELFADPAVTPAAYEAGLSQSGQAFLSASMLVLFKANTLAELELPAAAEVDVSVDDLQLEVVDGMSARVRLPLEQQIRRRPVALPPPKRRVTLNELIDQLQLMAAQLQLAQAASDQPNPSSSRRLRSQSRAEALRATLELAHQENLTAVAGEIEQFLQRHPQQMIAPGQDWLDLEQLVSLWTRTRSPAISAATNGERSLEQSEFLSPQPHDRVSVFWALLLLSAQSKVELSQEEFYQEIKIRPLLDPVVLSSG